MDERPSSTILSRLSASIGAWTEARRVSTSSEKNVIALRAGLELVPAGIGAALSEWYFGTIDARRARKIDETVRHLCMRVEELARQQALAVTPEYFGTDEFAVLFEACWRRILAEAQVLKLAAIRDALVSVVVDAPKFDFARREFFVTSLDGMGDVHIQLLQIFRGRFLQTLDTFETRELHTLLSAHAAADQDFVYAAIDVLANRRYVEHRSIPQVEDGRIEYARQRFRLTHLGAEFLDFVRRQAVAT